MRAMRRAERGLVALGSVPFSILVTVILFATGAVKCGGGEPVDFTTSSTSSSGEGGSGGSETGGDGGSGGSDGGPTASSGGEGGTGATGGSETATGGAGGSGGSVPTGGTGGGTGGSGGSVQPVGCQPPGGTGTNCAAATCGVIPGMEPASSECDATCSSEALVWDAAILHDYTLVFDDFTGSAGCDSCGWSYVVRVAVAGPGECVRATVSEGLRVEHVYEKTTCGANGGASCVVAAPVAGPKSGHLRLVVTVDPESVPAAAWLRIESELNDCADSALTCN